MKSGTSRGFDWGPGVEGRRSEGKPVELFLLLLVFDWAEIGLDIDSGRLRLGYVEGCSLVSVGLGGFGTEAEHLAGLGLCCLLSF